MRSACSHNLRNSFCQFFGSHAECLSKIERVHQSLGGGDFELVHVHFAAVIIFFGFSSNLTSGLYHMLRTVADGKCQGFFRRAEVSVDIPLLSERKAVSDGFHQVSKVWCGHFFLSSSSERVLRRRGGSEQKLPLTARPAVVSYKYQDPAGVF